ncbi:hypothetical protein CPB85DRAFT_1432904 [Mucidula mucida]|nr:hypothetical protein CPB85DRAFT_1432904 [Mucidula mucida]
MSTSPVETGLHSRCGSTSSASSSRSSSVFRGSRRSLHVRAHTEVPTTSHPLRDAPSYNDANVTRPTLTRRIRTGQLIDVPVNGSNEDQEEPLEGPAEATVLVHEVTTKDSLAGVSLKYGISLADLRRANHLWTTDPIHLRKVLYIPLDKSSRAHLFIKREKTPPPLISMHDNDSDDHLAANGHVPNVLLSPSSSSSKVPFKDNLRRPAATPVPAPSISRPSLHGRFASSPPNNSFNTLLTALPIAASTRDTIIARLSFDSTSSSYSDRAPNEGEMHALDDVPAGRRSEDFDMTPRPPYNAPKRSSPPPFNKLTHGDIGMTDVSIRSSRVRTSQLEPSPDMHLPATNGRGKVRRRLASVDFNSGS